MSKLDVTTQDLFLRLGATSLTRSAKADALFRRLRFDEQDQIKGALSRAPRLVDGGDIDAAPQTKKRPARAAMRKAIKHAL